MKSKPWKVRPQVEALEDRFMPAVSLLSASVASYVDSGSKLEAAKVADTTSGSMTLVRSWDLVAGREVNHNETLVRDVGRNRRRNKWRPVRRKK